MGGPKIRGPFFGSPDNKDHNMVGSILGHPIFGKLPCGVSTQESYFCRCPYNKSPNIS